MAVGDEWALDDLRTRVAQVQVGNAVYVAPVGEQRLWCRFPVSGRLLHGLAYQQLVLGTLCRSSVNARTRERHAGPFTGSVAA
jgi:hypothetical protein